MKAMRNAAGSSKANKQSNGKRKGDGSTTGRRTKVNENDDICSTGISRKASCKGNGNRNGKRKRVGATLGENSIAMGRDGNLMNDGRTVGDRSKKNRSDSAHTTKTSDRATNIEESGGRWKSKDGAGEGDGGESKALSIVGSNRANKQWNGNMKVDGLTAERRSNINESDGITSTGMNGRALSNGSRNRNRKKKEDEYKEGSNNTKKKSGRSKRGKKTTRTRINVRKDETEKK